MVKFIFLILTMPGVKLLVYVEIMNEDTCRLHLTLCIVFFIKFSVFGSSPKYWSRVQFLSKFNLNNLWTLLPPKKSWTYIPKWDIQNKTGGMSVEHKKFLGAMTAIVVACGNFRCELEKERNSYGSIKRKLCGISRFFWVFCLEFLQKF